MNVFQHVRGSRVLSEYDQSIIQSLGQSHKHNDRLFTDIPPENQFRMVDVLPSYDESVDQLNESDSSIDPRDVILLSFSADGRMMVSYTKPLKLVSTDANDESSTSQPVNQSMICIQFWSFYPGEKLSLLMEVPLVCDHDPSDLHEFGDELDDDVMALNGWSIQGIESPDSTCFVITCCSQSILYAPNQSTTYHLAFIPSPLLNDVQSIEVARRKCTVNRSFNQASDETTNSTWSVATDRVRPKVTIASHPTDNPFINHQLVSITSCDKLYCAEFCVSADDEKSQSFKHVHSQSFNRSHRFSHDDDDEMDDNIDQEQPQSATKPVNQSNNPSSNLSSLPSGFCTSDDPSIIIRSDWLRSPSVIDIEVHDRFGGKSMSASVLDQWTIDLERAVLDPIIVTHRQSKQSNESINPCCLLQDFDVATFATIAETSPGSSNLNSFQTSADPASPLVWHRFAVATLKKDIENESIDPSSFQATRPYTTQAVVFHFDVTRGSCRWALVRNHSVGNATREVMKVMKSYPGLDPSLSLFLECTSYKMCLDLDLTAQPALDRPNHRFDNRPVTSDQSLKQLIHPTLPYAIVL